jgi:hypothetical protein
VYPVDPDDPRLRQRPLWGLAILLLPILGVVFTFVAYGVMVGFGVRGRPAEGAQVTLAFTGCAEAAPVLADRLGDMGLDPEPHDVTEGFAFDVVLPADPEVAGRIPATLAAPGRLEIHGDGAVLATHADVTGASVRMDLMMTPSTLVNLSAASADRIVKHVRAHPEGRLVFVLDGVSIGTQSNRNPVGVGEVEIAPSGLGDEERWRAVAEWSVVVDHPLPCEVSRRDP